jgi:hypothetical protein
VKKTKAGTQHHAYNAIEDTMVAAVRAAVEPRSEKLIAGVREALTKDDFTAAYKLVNDFTLTPAIQAARPKFVELAISALLFGASRHKPVQEVSHVKNQRVPHYVEVAVNQLCNTLEHKASLRARAAALIIIHDAEEEHPRRKAALLKYNQNHDPENGQFTSGPQTGTKEFKTWFKDSKIVDDNGNPLRLYHGTDKSFSIFDPAKAGQKDSGYYGTGMYMTASTDSANGYAGWNGGAKGITGETLVEGANVMPLYASIKNPYIWPNDNQNVIKTKEEADKFTKDLIARGYDGVIAPSEMELGNKGKFYEVVAFNPEQVKSASGNKGTFDPKSKDITKSELHSNALKKIDMTAEEIGAKLSAAVMGGTTMLADVSSNLVTSRLAAYGFLAEAAQDNVTSYKISAILDDRTCPVCLEMDGTEFDGIDSALSRVEQSLSTDDPDELKTLAPFADQSKQGIKDLQDASPDDLQALGVDTPPFHPFCRCLLVAMDDEQTATSDEDTAALLDGLMVEEPVAESTTEAIPRVASSMPETLVGEISEDDWAIIEDSAVAKAVDNGTMLTDEEWGELTDDQKAIAQEIGVAPEDKLA